VLDQRFVSGQNSLYFPQLAENLASETSFVPRGGGAGLRHAFARSMLDGGDMTTNPLQRNVAGLAGGNEIRTAGPPVKGSVVRDHSGRPSVLFATGNQATASREGPRVRSSLASAQSQRRTSPEAFGISRAFIRQIAAARGARVRARKVPEEIRTRSAFEVRGSRARGRGSKSADLNH
jgi:hypothetical protein